MGHIDTVRGASWLRLAVLATFACALTALVPIRSAAAGRAVIPASAAPQFELLLGKIASHIAGRTVTVACQNAQSWAAIVTESGGNPSAESGFVATQWNGATGQLISISSVAELSSGICNPLRSFAAATIKPTECATRTTLALGAARTATRAASSFGPCDVADAGAVAKLSGPFLTRYWRTAVAILTLAHESIHLGGTVGGQLANGLAVGDPQAEAKADCYGMQWMGYVAEQLGDSPEDAQALASYVWEAIYPLSRTAHPAYWSAECRPGGALDARPPGATLWP